MQTDPGPYGASINSPILPRCSTPEPRESAQNTVVRGYERIIVKKTLVPTERASIHGSHKNAGVRTSSSHEPPEFTENTVDHQGAPLRLQQRAKTPLLESKYQKGRLPYLLQEY